MLAVDGVGECSETLHSGVIITYKLRTDLSDLFGDVYLPENLSGLSAYSIRI